MPRLMLIDDDPTMVALLRTLLEIDGYEVVSPADFNDLMGSIREGQPDLVLMDVFLKKVDGIEVLRELRGDDQLAPIPVVMTSGMDVSDQADEAGASAFVLKPYDPDQLTRVIQEQLHPDQGKQTRGPEGA